MSASALHGRYVEALDRDSAHEMLARRLEAASAAEAEAAEAANRKAEPARRAKVRYPKKSAPAPQEQGSVVHDILTSSVAKDLARTAVREILRGALGTARRR